jgi:hypothetical protein
MVVVAHVPMVVVTHVPLAGVVVVQSDGAEAAAPAASGAAMSRLVVGTRVVGAAVPLDKRFGHVLVVAQVCPCWLRCCALRCGECVGEHRAHALLST